MNKREKRKITNLKFGIFSDRYSIKYRILYLLRDVKLYFIRRRFVLKHGYAEPALYETAEWFIVAFKEIIYNYRHHASGYPGNMTKEEWNSILDIMLDLLNKMSDDYYWDLNKEEWDPEEDLKKEQAKKEFFKLFSKYFYNLWD